MATHARVRQLLAVNRYDEAISAAREVLASNPLDATAMRLLAAAQRSAGYLDDALESIERAVATNFSDADAHNTMGNVLSDLGRHEDAFASFETAIGLAPTVAAIKSNYVRAICVKPRPGPALKKRARELAELALSDDPDDVYVHVTRASVHMLDEEWVEADRSCRAALKIDANDATALKLLALAQRQQGLLREAGDSALAAGRADPRAADPDLLLSLGKLAAPVGLGLTFLVPRLARASGRGTQLAGGSEAAIIVVMLVVAILAWAVLADTGGSRRTERHAQAGLLAPQP